MKTITDYILEKANFLVKKHLKHIEYKPQVYIIGRKQDRNGFVVCKTFDEYKELDDNVTLNKALLVNPSIEPEDFKDWHIVAWPDIEDGEEFVYVNRRHVVNDNDYHFERELDSYSEITVAKWKQYGWK